MTIKADVTTSSNNIITDSVTSPVTGDLQVIELSTTSAGVVTLVSSANPLPTGLQQMPAAQDISDSIAVAPMLGKAKNGLADVTPIRVSTNVAISQTDLSLVAGVSLQRIRIHQMVITLAAVANTVTLSTKPAGASSAISPAPWSFAANGGIVLPWSNVAWLQTGVGDGLVITTGSGSVTSILITGFQY